MRILRGELLSLTYADPHMSGELGFRYASPLYRIGWLRRLNNCVPLPRRGDPWRCSWSVSAASRACWTTPLARQ